MLKKLLRYDLKFIFRYWWIAAISCTALSAVGGICFSLLLEKPPHALITLLLVLPIIFAVIGWVVFAVLSYLVIYIRFYKNFFTDEGYLTFTLPVNIGSLLNAKLLSAVITEISTLLVLGLDVFLMIALGGGEGLFELLEPILEGFFENVDIYFYIFVAEGLVWMLVSSLFSALFLCCCITFGSIITKKAKVPAAIGIYYVANCVFTGFIQFIALFSLPVLAEKIFALPQNTHGILIVLVLLALILCSGLVCLLLYALQYWMLHRKLNLN